MSGRSRKSVRSNHSGVIEEDGLPQHKKAFMDFHNGNGVRTVQGSIGPIHDGVSHIFVY